MIRDFACAVQAVFEIMKYDDQIHEIFAARCVLAKFLTPKTNCSSLLSKMSSAPLMCSLCAGPITVSIVIPCQHDQVCGVCIARMRVLQKKDQCAFCKVRRMFSAYIAFHSVIAQYFLSLQVKWDYCIFTTNRASRKPWNSYDLNSLTYDKFYCVYFDSIALFEWFKKLRSLYCVVCERTDHSSLSADLAVVAASNAVTDQYSKTTYFQSVKQLKNHLDHDHKKFLWYLLF
jgi:hypothetical protein